MIFKCLDTKNEKEIEISEKEIKDKTMGYSWLDFNILKSDFDKELLNFEEEEEKEEFKKYWADKNCTIYNDEKKYYIDLIENATWTSPTGIQSLYKVIEVID